MPEGGNGAPLFFVMNAGSGSTDADRAATAIDSAMQAAGRAHRVFRVETSQARLEDVARHAVAEAAAHDGVVVAVGGDGTLNAVAQAVLGSRCPFGAMPQGTFNYFGRNHGLPGDVGEAVQALLTARIERVPVETGQRPRLCSSSMPASGSTPSRWRSARRRSSVTVAAGSSRSGLRCSRSSVAIGPYRVRLEGDGIERELQTMTVFVGINALQLAQIGIEDAIQRGQFVAIVLRPASPMRLAWLVVRGALGRLVDANGVERLISTSLSVTPSSPRIGRMKIAVDGETSWTRVPVEFRIADEPLRLLKPVAATGDESTT